jgi:thioredoxin reductase
MEFDVLIIGGGAAGMSCALVLGSALEKPYAEDKRAGIILHQRASNLQSALFNNALGIPPGTSGASILKSGLEQLKERYPRLEGIEKEKVKEIVPLEEGFRITSNKNSYSSQRVVVAVGYSNLMKIKGLEEYVIPHKKAKASKNRIQLINKDHVVIPGLYVAGTLAGWRSQYAIACGSGAAVATDILTEWNKGEHTKVHDKLT